MNRTHLIILAIASLCTLSLACGKNNGVTPCGVNWANDIQDEANNLSNAILLYSQDPTPANCEAYRQAYLEYLDELKDWGNRCTLSSQDRKEWQEAIDDAEDEVDDIDC